MESPTDDDKALEDAAGNDHRAEVTQDSSANVAKASVTNGFFARVNERILSLKYIEARGIQRVPISERREATGTGYAQMVLLWFSANVTANNLAVGMLGPLVYGLSFTDSALCAVFGDILGSAGAAYMSTFGPESGNRTMVVARYFMGYYPSKICCLLNIIIMLGYGMIDCLVGGQVLSAVADGQITIIAGIIINAAITWLIATFGMSLFQLYERWAWAPQLVVLFVLVGSAGPNFDTTFPSEGDSVTINADRLTFLSLCLSAAVAWAPSAADYYVYYPPSTKRWKSFIMTLTGLTLSLSFVNLLGIGLASGTFTQPAWKSAYEVSSGALILAGYGPLGSFGKFCGVIVSFGVIANNIPGTYSAALGFQVLGRYGARIPRWFLTCICVVIYTVCALGGRDHLFDIFENFLALMGYWVTIYLTIVVEEHLLFRRTRGFNWEAWSDREKLPIGIAGLTAFLIGWAGAIICMNQVWYIGPVAKLVGEYGADLGIWVGCAWTMLIYPPIRWLELKVYDR